MGKGVNIMANIITRTQNTYTHKVLVCNAFDGKSRWLEVSTQYKAEDTTKKAKESLQTALKLAKAKTEEVIVSVQDIAVVPEKTWMPSIVWDARCFHGEPTKEAVKAAIASLFGEDVAADEDTEPKEESSSD